MFLSSDFTDGYAFRDVSWQYFLPWWKKYGYATLFYSVKGENQKQHNNHQRRLLICWRRASARSNSPHPTTMILTPGSCWTEMESTPGAAARLCFRTVGTILHWRSHGILPVPAAGSYLHRSFKTSPRSGFLSDSESRATRPQYMDKFIFRNTIYRHEYIDRYYILRYNLAVIDFCAKSSLIEA